MEQTKKKTSLFKKIMIGLGILLVIGIIGSQLEENEVKESNQESPKNENNQSKEVQNTNQTEVKPYSF